MTSSIRSAALSFLAVATLVGAAWADPPPQPIKLCISSAGEARYQGLGFDHVVRLSNGCAVPSECSVTTNVNPDAIKATVPPNQTVEVVTFRGSPASNFTHQAVCTPP